MNDAAPKQAIHAMKAAPAIVKSTRLNGHEKAVLMVLVYGPGCAFEDVTRPRPFGTSEVVRHSGFSRSTVRRSLASLLKSGFIMRTTRNGRETLYTVHISMAGEPLSVLSQDTHPALGVLSQDTPPCSVRTPTLFCEDTYPVLTGHPYKGLKDNQKVGKGAVVVVAQPPSPSVVPSPSLDEDGLHPWERADSVDNLGWPIEADGTKEESDEQDRSSGDDAAARRSGEPDRGAGSSAGNDTQGGRPLGPSRRDDGCEGDRAGESDSTRADAVRARAGVVDPNEWVERIKTACSGPVTPAPEGWAELRQLLADSAGMQSVGIERDLRKWAQEGHALLNAQGLHTPAQRVAVMLAGYRGCIKVGSAAPRALWIVERGCRQTVLAKAEAPKMRPLQPAGPRVVRNKTSAARFAAMEQS